MKYFNIPTLVFLIFFFFISLPGFNQEKQFTIPNNQVFKILSSSKSTYIKVNSLNSNILQILPINKIPYNSFYQDIMYYKGNKFTHYIITSKRLYKILNEISNFCDTCKERPGSKAEPIVETENKYKNLDPSLKEKYNLIVRQIKLRQEELNKMDKNDKKRIPLENELVAYKKAADRIKAQFK